MLFSLTVGSTNNSANLPPVHRLQKGIQTSNLDPVGIKENFIMRWVLVFLLPTWPLGSVAPSQVPLGKTCLSLGEEELSSGEALLPLPSPCFTSDGLAHFRVLLQKALTLLRKAAGQAKPSHPFQRAETITGTAAPTSVCLRWLRFGSELVVFQSLKDLFHLPLQNKHTCLPPFGFGWCLTA